jgi:myo-inositol-1(or 4)-monophosphatase
MENNNIDKFLIRQTLAEKVARSAGVMAMKYFTDRDELTVNSKGLQDRVTKADMEVEKYIFKTLNEAYPNDGFLGEEMASGEPINIVDEGTWVVDPIDGTNCFLFGIPAWCISIAWMQNGEPKIGVIYDAMHDEMYSAVLGNNATLNGNPIRVSDAKSLTDGLTAMECTTSLSPDKSVDPMKRLMESGGVFFRCGSGTLTLAWVAVGRLIGYYAAHINSWDCLAGIVLIREAGGKVNDFLANDGLTKGNTIIASAPGVVKDMEKVSGHKF